MSDALPLLSPSPSSPSSLFSSYLKYVSLLLLLVQNPSHQIMLRLSRTLPPPCSHYHTSEVVLYSECLKCVLCSCVVLTTQGTESMRSHLVSTDTIRLSLPALLFTAQNNLQFVAASHMGPETLQIVYQAKTLFTAGMGACLLRRVLHPRQWVALLLLASGMALSQHGKGKREEGGDDSFWVGMSAALAVCLFSSFAAVYMEGILNEEGREREASLSMRNVQLCASSIPLQMVAVYARDWDSIRRTGWGYGFCPMTVGVMLQFGLGGLLTAMTMKFADSNWKNLVTALSILLTCLLSVPLFGFVPDLFFALGGGMVVIAIFLYAW